LGEAARFCVNLAYLFLRNGKWKDRQLVSEEWIRMARVPSEVNPNYGYMWWLNSGPRRVPGWPESVFSAVGFGGKHVVIDQEHDLLIVVRWLEPSKMGGFFQLVAESLESN
jgi:CubicO group peptidase (beta-lactamase class C family)